MKITSWRLAGLLVTAAVAGYIIVAVAGMLSGCASRPAPPPPGIKTSMPFGAIDINEMHLELDSMLQKSITKSLLNPSGWRAAAAADGNISYDILALTGGGSRGAFGAGILCGWTDAGSRPDFKIVTGVSTGALQSTFAFLGSEYDTFLKEIYTQYETSDLYQGRSSVVVLFSDAANNSHGLKKLIDQYVTPAVLEAVAEKYRKGYRLFVGTTNLDTTEFIIWDMGKIAGSGRPDALEQYRKVLLASAAIPVFFPPVYFEVESDGKIYHEMHVDGSTYANLLFRGFMIDIEDAMKKAGLRREKYNIRLFVIRNGRRDEESVRSPVPGKTLSIAETTIRTLFKLASTSSMYRAYVLAGRNDIDFNLAVIPVEYQFDFEVTDFDREGMGKLFDFGYEQTRDGGYDWMKVPPFIDPDETFE